MTRGIGVLFAAALLLSSCGGSDPQSYSSVTDMGEALQEAGVGCGDLKVVDQATGSGDEESLPSQTGNCGEVQLFLFEDESARDKWLTLGGTFSENIATGPNWTVIAPDEDTAEEIADALGGET
jgi:hypothetical protein